MYMNAMKRILALVLALCCVLGLTACGFAGGTASEATTFSWWLTATENTDYYFDYDENPVVQYVQKCLTFEDSNGDQSHIAFDFQNGVAGQEYDNCQNMIATGTYPDVMGTTYCPPILEMYESGMILDLTEYVQAYMPNYLAYMEAHPEFAKIFTHTIDGEQKFLTVLGCTEAVDMYDQWYGYQYRRDWIVKYGVQPDQFWTLDENNNKIYTDNPDAGKAFSGYYSLDLEGNAIEAAKMDANVDGDSWVDDVVFPSGGTDPVYISDWEWMMEIFEKAMAAEGITDSYILSIYYPGYLQVGDLVSGFGGIGPMWYLEDGVAKFGTVEEGFKSYMKCMNAWYEKGWLDKQFAERTGDPFYQIDDTNVRQGKVGIWLGQVSELLSRMQNPSLPNTEGIVSFACASPINDLYGAPETMYQNPTVFFGDELVGDGIVITDKAKDKDLKVLFEYLDYMFSPEGRALKTAGLTAEQVQEAGITFYQQYGIEGGTYEVVEKDGEIYYDLHPILDADEGGIRSACVFGRATGLDAGNRVIREATETYDHMFRQWTRYTNHGAIEGIVNSLLTHEGSVLMQKVTPRIGTEYMAIEVPKFINGTYDIDERWAIFCADLMKRNYQALCDAYNEVLGS